MKPTPRDQPPRRSSEEPGGDDNRNPGDFGQGSYEGALKADKGAKKVPDVSGSEGR